jgi:hypothetical protein
LARWTDPGRELLPVAKQQVSAVSRVLGTLRCLAGPPSAPTAGPPPRLTGPWWDGRLRHRRLRHRRLRHRSGPARPDCVKLRGHLVEVDAKVHGVLRDDLAVATATTARVAGWVGGHWARPTPRVGQTRAWSAVLFISARHRVSRRPPVAEPEGMLILAGTVGRSTGRLAGVAIVSGAGS